MDTERLLSEKYEALNQAWIKAIVELKKIKCPYDVFMEVDDDNLIGFAKVNGSWRIVRRVVDDRGHPTDTAIENCPVAVRIDMAKHVKDLHDRCVRSKEAVIPDVDDAIAHLSWFKEAQS
jgi:hypothetical protein